MPALKAVIDTSVMVSVGFAKQGLAKELKDMIAADNFGLITSKQILIEYSALISAAFLISSLKIKNFILLHKSSS